MKFIELQLDDLSRTTILINVSNITWIRPDNCYAQERCYINFINDNQNGIWVYKSLKDTLSLINGV